MDRRLYSWVCLVVTLAIAGATWPAAVQKCHDEMVSHTAQEIHQEGHEGHHMTSEDHADIHTPTQTDESDSDCPCCDYCAETCIAVSSVISAVSYGNPVDDVFQPKLRAVRLIDTYSLPPPEQLLRPPIPNAS